MKYAVMFCEEYVGYYFDEYSKIFNSKKQANKYRNKLNMEVAEANDCDITNSAEYYIIVKVAEEK